MVMLAQNIHHGIHGIHGMHGKCLHRTSWVQESRASQRYTVFLEIMIHSVFSVYSVVEGILRVTGGRWPWMGSPGRVERVPR